MPSRRVLRVKWCVSTLGRCVAKAGTRVAAVGWYLAMVSTRVGMVGPRVATIGSCVPTVATHRGIVPPRGSERLLVGSAILRHAAICPRDVHDLMIVFLPVPPTASGSPVIDAELWKNIL